MSCSRQTGAPIMTKDLLLSDVMAIRLDGTTLARILLIITDNPYIS